MKKISILAFAAAISLFSLSALAFGPTPEQCDLIQDPHWRSYCYALIGG